jgi:DNA-directed RNA polymerase beta subunit
MISFQDPRFQKYSKLDQDGVCRVGEKLEPMQIMINKQTPINTTTESAPSTTPDGGTHKPSPLSYKAPGGHFVHVDKVHFHRKHVKKQTPLHSFGPFT